MTERNLLNGKQGNDGTAEGDAAAPHEKVGSGPVTGESRRLEGVHNPKRDADEQGQHPNRVDGSENPESGDALLQNHENGVWNKEREAEAVQERENAAEGENAG